MTKGIYCYIDLQNNHSIVYIGKDSHIDEFSRHRTHINQSNYNAQPFNRVLQNNRKRYVYEVLCESEHYSDVYLNLLEKGLIKVYNPKFNFTTGGDGVSGFRHSDETKSKMSKSRKGKNNPRWKDYPRIIKAGIKCGKQCYAIMYNGRVIKQSIFLDKLEKELDLLIKEVY